MSWTTPRTWNVGELVTKAIMDTHVRDNLSYLKGIADIALDLVARQGGSATNWETQGTNNYTPTTVKAQSGVIRVASVTTASGSLFNGTVTITFPEAFVDRPQIFCQLQGAYIDKTVTVSVTSISTTQATMKVVSSASTSNVDISWLAIGEQ